MTQKGPLPTPLRRTAHLAKAALVALVLGWALAPVAGLAQPANPFEVRGVRVDVTAKSAAEARVQALNGAEVTAFRAMLERLTLAAYHDRLPLPDHRRITELIVDFDISNEKASQVRYIANLNYRFKPDEVRALLDGSGIPFAETESKPVVVLPVYQAAGALLLWDEPNLWRDAWRDRSEMITGLVPTLMPKGDLADMRIVGAEQAIEGDAQRLEEIATRYGAGDVIVAHGILRMDSFDGLPGLEVYMTRFGSALQEHTVVKSFSSEPGEDIKGLLTRAAKQLTAQIEDNWKQDNLIRNAEPAVLTVRVPIATLKDWVQVRDRLNGVAVVRDTEVTLFSRNSVQVNLNFIGDAEQLALSLDQADLVLWGEAGNWHMGLRKDVPGGDQPPRTVQ